MLPELQALTHELNANQGTFTTFLRSLDDTKLNASGANNEYSPREALAHLVGAEISMLRMAKNWMAGQDNRLRPDFDRDFFNRRQLEKRAGQSLDDLLADWQMAQRGLIALMETVTEQDLDKRGDHPSAKDTTLRNLFLIITTHEADHMRAVMNANHA